MPPRLTWQYDRQAIEKETRIEEQVDALRAAKAAATRVDVIGCAGFGRNIVSRLF